MIKLICSSTSLKRELKKQEVIGRNNKSEVKTKADSVMIIFHNEFLTTEMVELQAVIGKQI